MQRCKIEQLLHDELFGIQPAIRQWAASLPTELIKQVDDKDGDLLITLAAVDQKDAFLTALTGQGFDLDGFQVYEPSLNDIFVSYTEGAV